MVERRLSEEIAETNKLLKQVIEGGKIPGERKFRVPKLSNSKLKKGYVIVQVLKNNNYVDFRKLKVMDGNVYLKEGETYHLADSDYIGMYKKFPLVILPEWSIEPITKESLLRKVDENKSTVKPQKQIIHLMEDAKLAEQSKPKKGMKGFLIIALILVGGYLLGKKLGWFG